jgi:hypothetical protein
MKLFLFAFFALLGLFSILGFANDDAIQQAYYSQQDNLQVQGSGKVTHVLTDDTNGSKHQRFIVRLTNNQTLLIAHNIDLAPRVSDLAKGDIVDFYGVYEYNPKGGVVHWTHKDPQNKHIHGWLKHRGLVYQ